MGKITVLENKLIFRRKDELTIIEPYGENCLRCRSTKNSQILDGLFCHRQPRIPAKQRGMSTLRRSRTA